ncbi:MAG: RNA polymerase sigma factor [Hyphomicrobiaceae bacterium]|nr:RNA polymerase sigma factor [Hyphomicrobiaceae bacterium]
MSLEVRRELVSLLPRLRRFAYSLTGSLDDADDVVQTACLRALTRLDQFTPGTRLDSWMFRIVQTVTIDRARSVRRAGIVGEPEDLEQIGYDQRIHESTEARIDLAIVRKAMVEDLPEEQRAVLALVCVDGMSYQDAADTLAIPVGTVMSRLARARRKLAAVLEAQSPGAMPRPEQTGGGH